MSTLTRQQRIARNLRIHNTQQKINRILSISPLAISETIAQTAHNRMLADLIDISSLVNERLHEQYCNKSGNFINSFTPRQLIELVNIHGVNRSRFILQQQQLSYIAPAWLFTDPEALNQLTRHDPIGYFCHVGGLILHGTNIQRATATAPQYTLESQLTYAPISKEEATDMAQPAMMQLANLAHSRLLALVTANKQLQTGIISDERIVEANELMRRYLSLIGSTGPRWNRQLASMPLPQITASVPQFNSFIAALSQSIADVISAITSKHKHQTTPDYVTYQDILEVKRKHGGHSNMLQQKALRAPSKSDAIMFDLREFVMDSSPASKFVTPNMPKRIEAKPLPTISKPATIEAPKQFTGLKLGSKSAAVDNSPQSPQSKLAALLKGSR